MKKDILVIDFEVLSKARFWLCCIKNLTTKKITRIYNNKTEFKNFYQQNKDAIWVGYNISGYDQWIARAIIANINPFQVSDIIINNNMSPWKISPELNKIKFTYFEVGDRTKSLKKIECFLGESIEETSVPFDLDRTPTKEEIESLAHYCEHDVLMTERVFQETYSRFQTQLDLVELYNLKPGLVSKTLTQLSEIILDAKKPMVDRNDAYEYKIIEAIKLKKYAFVKDWYLSPENHDERKSLKVDVLGITITFGWGGAHGAAEKIFGEGVYILSDVSGFYSSTMILHDLLSRNCRKPERYGAAKSMRDELKAIKDSRQIALKEFLNRTYGATRAINSELYDPKTGNAVCVNGQLMLLDLAERMEEVFGSDISLIQANTDGLLFKLKSDTLIEKYLEICKEWSERVGLSLDHDYVKKIAQKDVNNYVIVKDNGSLKSVGAYIKKLSPIDNDLPIVNKAIREFLVNDTPIRDTITRCDNLIDFQKAIVVSKNYTSFIQNGVEIPLKTLRVFASKRVSDSSIRYYNKSTQAEEKVGNCPGRAFIDNSRIVDKKVPSHLDKEWYIALAEKRARDFVPSYDYEMTLFDMLE